MHHGCKHSTKMIGIMVKSQEYHTRLYKSSGHKWRVWFKVGGCNWLFFVWVTWGWQLSFAWDQSIVTRKS